MVAFIMSSARRLPRVTGTGFRASPAHLKRCSIRPCCLRSLLYIERALGSTDAAVVGAMVTNLVCHAFSDLRAVAALRWHGDICTGIRSRGHRTVPASRPNHLFVGPAVCRAAVCLVSVTFGSCRRKWHSPRGGLRGSIICACCGRLSSKNCRRGAARRVGPRGDRPASVATGGSPWPRWLSCRSLPGRPIWPASVQATNTPIPPTNTSGHPTNITTSVTPTMCACSIHFVPNWGEWDCRHLPHVWQRIYRACSSSGREYKHGS